MTQDTVKRYETMPIEAQTALVKEYMAYAEGWSLYDAWLQAKNEGKGMEHSDGKLRLFCESLDSFWEFLSRE